MLDRDFFGFAQIDSSYGAIFHLHAQNAFLREALWTIRISRTGCRHNRIAIIRFGCANFYVLPVSAAMNLSDPALFKYTY